MVPGHPDPVCFDCGGAVEELDFDWDRKFHCVVCRRKKLGREPKERTTEECRSLFLEKVWAYIAYWEKEGRAVSSREKLEGLAHSFLVILDGGTMDIPGFIVAPAGHPDNEGFHKERAQDWWPYNGKEIQDKVKADIAGSLHELFDKHNPVHAKVKA